jgi:serine/threonine protein kinase
MNYQTAKRARFSDKHLNCRLPRFLKRGRFSTNINCEVHGSSRSHIYLAVDTESDTLVIIKIPSIDLRGDPAYLKRFMMEEWAARRINSPYVLKPCLQSRKRNYLYVVMKFIKGQTLTQ